MQENNPANGTVCDNCGIAVEHGSIAVIVQIHQKPLQFCARCHTERSANLALMNMTWGSAS